MHLHSGVNVENFESVKSVTVFSTTTCSSCKVLMSWLEKENVSYVKKMTDEDEEAMAEFMKVNDGAFGVPFTVIEYESGPETKIIGFHKSKFKEALRL